MKILSVNAGSSTLKFRLYEMPEEKVLISGNVEKIGLPDSFYSLKINGEKIKKEAKISNHEDSVKILIKELLENKVIESLDEIKGVGHRLVQGGDKFKESVLLTDEVLKECEKFNDLAPLHNPAMLSCIKAFKEAMPNAKMTGVFDTSFHQTMQEIDFLYPVPYSWYKDYGIRKYGYHGTSHKYITKRMEQILGKEKVNIINCHIGSGSSICCIKDSKSIDTTMGFSPNSGLMMGTRSGDIDYSIIPFYMNKSGKSLQEVDNILNKESGLLGISGISSDHRDIEEVMNNGNERCRLADNMYVNKVVGYIANYFVKLNGEVDALVFTAGLGENAREFREEIVSKLSSLGIKIDKEENMKYASYMPEHEGKISSDDSSVQVYVIPTDEELMIAKETFDLI